MLEGSLHDDDFAPGQLPQGPPGPTAAGVATSPATPTATPDVGDTSETAAVNAPTPGRLLVMLNTRAAVDCSSGDPNIGLYVDGVPVPNTRRNLQDTNSALSTNAVPVNSSGITAAPVSAANHSITVGVDCPAGNLLSSFVATPSLTGLLLGG